MSDDVFYPGRVPGEIRRPNGRRIDIDAGDPSGRGGVPPDKFGCFSVTLNDPQSKRTAVVMQLFPPEQLRDAPIEVIRAAIANSAATILEEIVQTIHRSYTSDPLDADAARTLSEAFAKHADGLRKP